MTALLKDEKIACLDKAFELSEALFRELGKLQNDNYYIGHVSRDPFTHAMNLVEAVEATIQTAQRDEAIYRG